MTMKKILFSVLSFLSVSLPMGLCAEEKGPSIDERINDAISPIADLLRDPESGGGLDRLSTLQPLLIATEVALGRADAFLYDQLSVLGASKKHADTTRAILTPLTREPYAMAARHGDTRMVARLNEFLAAIRADGRYQALRDVYLNELPDGSK